MTSDTDCGIFATLGKRQSTTRQICNRWDAALDDLAINPPLPNTVREMTAQQLHQVYQELTNDLIKEQWQYYERVGYASVCAMEDVLLKQNLIAYRAPLRRLSFIDNERTVRALAQIALDNEPTQLYYVAGRVAPTPDERTHRLRVGTTAKHDEIVDPIELQLARITTYNTLQVYSQRTAVRTGQSL